MELNQTPHTIEISDQQSAEFDADPLIAAIRMIADDHKISRLEISVAVVDDPTIRKLNQKYLQHDYETDVISFVLDWDEDAGSLLGQLIVSTDTAASLAEEVGSTMQEELLLYVIHGMLHLVGYDDKQPAAALTMRAAEKQYLSRFNTKHQGFDSDSATQTPQRRR